MKKIEIKITLNEEEYYDLMEHSRKEYWVLIADLIKKVREKGMVDVNITEEKENQEKVGAISD